MTENKSPSNENAAIFFVDRHADGPCADKPAFIEANGRRQISYRDLAVESGRMSAMYQRHGIRREDRVALLVLDQIDFPIAFWGSIKAGVIPVALNTLLATDVYTAILEDSRARALIVSEELYAVVEPLLKDHAWLERIFVVGETTPAGCLSFRDELARSEAGETVQSSADECAFWLYSSGSTGQPKGVRHVHSSLQATADTYGSQVMGVEPSDVVFSAAKLFFAYGLGNSMTFPMSVGATTILFAGRPTPQSVIDLLNDHNPTIFCGVPTLYAALLAALEGGDTKLNVKLRRCISAGEALPADIGKRWEQLTGTEILDGVGSTEMLHIFLSNRSGDVEYGTSGTPVPGYEMRLVDENGSEVSVGEVGELLVKGASSAADYWNKRDKSRTTFEGEWTRTGDKYEKTDSGRLIYCGRTDDMFKVSGIWVSPFEVEQALVSHPAILEAAVVAAKDEDGLEKPKAFVVLKPGADGTDLADALKTHVQDKIGKWKYPRWIEIADDLPKTATGKVQRFKLRG